VTVPMVSLSPGGPWVGAQGFGCMGMSEFYGPTDVEESLKTLDMALDRGITLYDTADIYGAGHNEEFIGSFIRANRDHVVISTKFGLVRREDDPSYRGIENSPAYIRRAVEGSLRRLGVDRIDLYFAHRISPHASLEETIGTMAELVAEGKVGALGLCEVSGAELRAAHAVHPIAAVQSEWSLFARGCEADIVPVAAELGVGFMPFSPLGRGFLAGLFSSADELSSDDYRRHMDRYVGANARHNANLLAPIRRIAERHELTPAQVSLSWVHHRATTHGLSVVPIPGTRSRSRLEENVRATHIVLEQEELRTLEPIAAQVAGARVGGLSFVPAGEDA
jgi:aryl-alcohol dehydrogenase-like predicted oxidoreductase